jgi:N-acetylglucosamine-6-sulfatase
MQNQLYTMMEELGGMEIPLNRPKGQRKTERLRSQGGEKAADFPEAFLVDEALRKEL